MLHQRTYTATNNNATNDNRDNDNKDNDNRENDNKDSNHNYRSRDSLSFDGPGQRQYQAIIYLHYQTDFSLNIDHPDLLIVYILPVNFNDTIIDVIFGR